MDSYPERRPDETRVIRVDDMLRTRPPRLLSNDPEAQARVINAVIGRAVAHSIQDPFTGEITVDVIL